MTTTLDQSAGDNGGGFPSSSPDNKGADVPSSSSSSSEVFKWTTATIIQSIFLFGLAGVAEILGGWMVWMAIRGNSNTNTEKPRWYGLLGSMLLVVYGFIPCLQPTDNFGRIYAAYGGFFIVMSFLFGWALDGDRPDMGDIVGGPFHWSVSCWSFSGRDDHPHDHTRRMMVIGCNMTGSPMLAVPQWLL